MSAPTPRAAHRLAGRRSVRPGAALLLVLVLLAAGTAGAVATAPEPSPVDSAVAPTRQVSVARAGAACPDPVVGVGTVSRVAVASSGPVRPTARDGSRPGQAALRTLGGSQLLRFVAPGAAAVDATPDHGPMVARGTAGSAPGLAASQLTRSTEATMRGLAGTRCAPAGTDFWFVGSGAVIGQRGRVYLTNPEPAPAIVDITLYGPDGLIDAPAGRGVSVAGGEQEVKLLDALAPGTTRFAVHVHARQGRIAAAVRDQQVDGLTPMGADWVPAAAPPAALLRVPGVPGGAGERRLQVVAPGGSDAIVRLRLVGEAGTVAADGLEVLEVPAGSVADVDLAPYAAGEPVTVELEADAPVTAGLLARVEFPPPGLAEFAYAAAVPPLTATTPGVIPEVRVNELLTTRLWLTAPEGSVTVTLTPLPPATATPTKVTVAGGSVLPVDLSAVSTAESFAVSVVPRGGPVLAAVQVDEVEARGGMVTSTPVPPGQFVVTVPRVVADLSTGLQGGG